MLQQLKINQPETVQAMLEAVTNETFRKGRISHWDTPDNGNKDFATVKKFCWLYCWIITTGASQARAREDARIVFNTAFNFTFETFEAVNAADRENLHREAKYLRESDSTEEDEEKLAKYLSNLPN
jgi:hypothetical protein